jgi:hypothetical protein
MDNIKSSLRSLQIIKQWKLTANIFIRICNKQYVLNATNQAIQQTGVKLLKLTKLGLKKTLIINTHGGLFKTRPLQGGQIWL